MMKKIYGLLVAFFAVVILGACASDDLDGVYYEFNKEDSYLYEEPTITIDGTIAELNGTTVTVDIEKKEFSKAGKTLSYIYKDGALTVNGELYVKKGSEAYDEADKSNQNRLKKEAKKEKKRLASIKERIQGKYYARGEYTHEIAKEPSFEISGSKIVVYNFEISGKEVLDKKEYDLSFESSGTINVGDKMKCDFVYSDEESILGLTDISIIGGKNYPLEELYFVKK